MSLTHLFSPITKSEMGDDGVLTVYGKMTGPDLDLDGISFAQPAVHEGEREGPKPVRFEAGRAGAPGMPEGHHGSALGRGDVEMELRIAQSATLQWFSLNGNRRHARPGPQFRRGHAGH